MFRRGDIAKPLLGQADRRFEQACPRQLAVLLVRRFEQAHGARRADRATADDGVVERHRLAVGPQKEPLVGRHRRRLAAVEGHDLLAVPVHQEGATAETGTLRLDQRQHQLDCDRGVDRAAAGAQDLESGFGRERVGRSGHVPLRRRPSPARCETRDDGFGLRRAVGRGGAGGEQR